MFAGSQSLRSNVLCLKCFGCFEQLSDCENKIIKLKEDLWRVYKKTCEKYGEIAENYIDGISTQTDFDALECGCKLKKPQTVINLKSEQCDEDKNNKNGL